MKTDDPSDNLEYQIALSDDGSYLRIVFFVDMTNELSERSLVGGYRMSEEMGVFKHFVDVTRVRSAQSATDMYMLVYNRRSVSPLYKKFKIAVVTHPDDNSHDFIETLFFNNGVNGKVFKNEDEALLWLKE